MTVSEWFFLFILFCITGYLIVTELTKVIHKTRSVLEEEISELRQAIQELKGEIENLRIDLEPDQREDRGSHLKN